MRTHSTAVAFQQNNTRQNLNSYKPVHWATPIHMFVAGILAALGFVSAQVHAAAPQDTELKELNASSPTTAKTYTIAPQLVSSALKAFAEQSDMQLIYTESDVGESRTAGIDGKLPPDQALARILQGTDLQFQFTASNVIVITKVKDLDTSSSLTASGHSQSSLRLVQSETENMQRVEDPKDSHSESTPPKSSPHMGEDLGGGIPEILVMGSKVLNADIRRTEDDAQPYIIFDRETVESSGAANLEEFLKARLTMNVNPVSGSQSEGGGNRSTFNLRGLGNDETLLLIDGRRVAGVNLINPRQGDINGIPISAIERIEVLPTTASGIYGGGATGGVINVVLRRDYAGIETKLTYGNSFESDVATRRVDISAGFNLEGGDTNVLIAASYSDANALLRRERDLTERARQHVLATNPDFYLGGSPPVGATPNIRSNEVVNGQRQNLTLDSGTSLNSTFAFVPYGYAGHTADGGSAFIGAAGQYNLDLPATSQREGVSEPLLASPRVKSLMMTLRRQFTPRIRTILELQTSDTETTRAFNLGIDSLTIAGHVPSNPFQEDITVTIPAVGMDGAVRSTAEERRVVGGVIMELSRGWQAFLDLTWHRSSSSYVYPGLASSATIEAISTGALDILRDPNVFPIELIANSNPGFASRPAITTLRDAVVRLAGSLPWTLSAGQPVISTLIEHREEDLDELLLTSFGADMYIPSRSQSVDSVYFEVGVPLVSSRNSMPGIRTFDLQLATRWDAYRTNGAAGLEDGPITRSTNRIYSIDPTIGLLYRPMDSVVVRGSYGTGFLPPSVFQLVSNEDVFPVPFLQDPLRGGEQLGTVLVKSFGNPDLRPETSKTWSAGLIFTPGWLPGARMSVDWSRIEKKDNIGALSMFTQPGFEETIQFRPDLITRGPPSGGFDVGPVMALDARFTNIAKLRTEALDLAMDYHIETERADAFEFSARATHLISLETQSTPAAPIVENAGVLALSVPGGVRWAGNASVSWMHGGWSVGWRTRFFDSYFLNTEHGLVPNQGSASVPSQIYHDVFGSYRSEHSSSAVSLFADTEIRFGINNVLNKKPPIDVTIGSGGHYSALGDPRLANYYVTLTKTFGSD